MFVVRLVVWLAIAPKENIVGSCEYDRGDLRGNHVEPVHYRVGGESGHPKDKSHLDTHLGGALSGEIFPKNKDLIGEKVSQIEIIHFFPIIRGVFSAVVWFLSSLGLHSCFRRRQGAPGTLREKGLRNLTKRAGFSSLRRFKEV